jgi:hypothetical protein
MPACRPAHERSWTGRHTGPCTGGMPTASRARSLSSRPVPRRRRWRAAVRRATRRARSPSRTRASTRIRSAAAPRASSRAPCTTITPPGCPRPPVGTAHPSARPLPEDLAAVGKAAEAGTWTAPRAGRTSGRAACARNATSSRAKTAGVACPSTSATTVRTSSSTSPGRPSSRPVHRRHPYPVTPGQQRQHLLLSRFHRHHRATRRQLLHQHVWTCPPTPSNRTATG